MGNDFSERRKYVRLALRSRILYYIVKPGKETDEPPEKNPATGKNIGVAGVLLCLNEKLKVGTIVDLEIYLPGRDVPIRTRGEARWCTPCESTEEHPGKFDAGIKFLLIDKDYVILLLKYVCGDLEDMLREHFEETT